MKFDFRPWNWYIFLAAFVLLIIFGIITAVKASCVGQIVQTWKPAAAQIRRNIELTRIKTQVLKEKKEADKKKPGLREIILLLAAMHKFYKNQEEKGPSGMRRAAVKAVQERSASHDLSRILLKSR